MADPITVGGLVVVLGDAYSRLVNAAIQNPGLNMGAIQNGITTIQSAINAQNQAHFTAAKMALVEGKLDVATNHLRDGLAVDQMNAEGWGVYCRLLAIQGNDDAAFTFFVQMAEWFGPLCPALPQEMRDALKENNDVVIPSLFPITKNLSGLTSDVIDITRHGIVATAPHSFYPWTKLYPWNSNEGISIYPSGILIVTDRFLVTYYGHHVYDLEAISRGVKPDAAKQNLTSDQIDKAFGKISEHAKIRGWTLSSETKKSLHRGAQVSAEQSGIWERMDEVKPTGVFAFLQNSTYKFSSINAYKATVMPIVVPPQPARVLQLPPAVLAKLLLRDGASRRIA